MYQTVYNPGSTPVVIDVSGKTVGGDDWSPVLSTDEKAKKAIDSGRVVVIDAEQGEDGRDTNARALAALAVASGYAERSAQIADLGKPELVKLAKAGGLVGRDDEEPLVDDLRRQLVESDVDLTVKQSRSRSAAGSNE